MNPAEASKWLHKSESGSIKRTRRRVAVLTMLKLQDDRKDEEDHNNNNNKEKSTGMKSPAKVRVVTYRVVFSPSRVEELFAAVLFQTALTGPAVPGTFC